MTILEFAFPVFLNNSLFTSSYALLFNPKLSSFSTKWALGDHLDSVQNSPVLRKIGKVPNMQV